MNLLNLFFKKYLMNLGALLVVMNSFPQAAQLTALGQQGLKTVRVVFRVTHFLFWPLHHSTWHLSNKGLDFMSCHLTHLFKTDVCLNRSSPLLITTQIRHTQDFPLQQSAYDVAFGNTLSLKVKTSCDDRNCLSFWECYLAPLGMRGHCGQYRYSSTGRCGGQGALTAAPGATQTLQGTSIAIFSTLTYPFVLFEG